MITDAGKKWIAEHFGVGNCWVYSGLSWTTYYTGGGSDPETGGTAKITARLTNPAVNERVVLSSPRTGTYRTADLTAGNGGNVVSLDDVLNIIIPNDGDPAGENQYCYTAGAPPQPTGDTGYFALCTLPGGADIYIDGAKLPQKAPLCPSAPLFHEVTAYVNHTVKYVLSGYKDYVTSASVSIGGINAAWQIFAVLGKESGPNTGTLRLTAHEWVPDAPHKGQELYARPSIAGTTMEEKLLTPLTINLSIPAGATSKEYEVGAIHPGYEKVEKTVTLRKTHTPANPLVEDLLMKEVRIWREVRIVEKMPKVAWVTGISIPSIMAWNISYSGWVKFVFTLATTYRAHLDLFARPSGWDGRLESLPTTRTARISTVEEELTPWPENEVRLDWSWLCSNAIPEGTYVVVSVIEYEV